MIDTNSIRKQLLKVTRKATNKRLDRLLADVLGLCDSYDQMTNMNQIIKAGEDSLNHSFDILEKLRKSL